ncbi:hypothetical protein G7054_g15285 [Neopestalotiopsis clavispora]|nr:hypothetical protein G7054_g15285 [Neopestalotiopsis clavispora]
MRLTAITVMFTALLGLGQGKCATSLIPRVDVAIVGGGISGLAAAKDVANAGMSFAVIEARDRVGGRILNAEVANGVEELGAEFVGPTQDRVLALAQELGLTTYPVYTRGNTTLYANNTATNYEIDLAAGGFPPLEPNVLLELQAFAQEIDGFAGELDVFAPWNHTNASVWDGMTLNNFLSGRFQTYDAQFLVQTAITSVGSAEASEVSLLWWLAYIASAGNETIPGTLERLIGVQGAAQDSRVNGGTQLLALKLAEMLGSENIHLSSPVRKITQDGDSYVVESDGFKISASHVVVAMSPPMAGRIIYHPLLPAGRDQLTQRMPMGSIGKVVAIYDTPWWREFGLNAQVISDSGVIRSTFDNSPANASFGAIMGLIEAEEMRKLDMLTDISAKNLVKDDLVKYFGPRAANVTTMLLQRWDMEEFSRGGPVAYGPPGVLTQYGDFLRTPYGHIHFAGTETAPYWTGYMDGAIRSGERAAAEILASISR